MGEPGTESSSRNRRGLCLEGGRSSSADSAGPLVYSAAREGLVPIEDDV